MKLKKVVINGFRSVKGTVPLLVEDRVTVLIGANDHGKTNLLDAIALLNDDGAQLTNDDVNWDSTDEATVSVEWHFEPTDGVLKTLASWSDIGGPGDGTVPPAFPVNSDNRIIYSRARSPNIITVKSLPISVPLEQEKAILAMRPRVELFAPPSLNLKDQVNAADLEKPEFEFMQGIFRLAGIWDARQGIFTQNDATSKLLDEASAKLTNVLNDKWNQGKDLKWKLEHTGTNGDHVAIRIQDPAIDKRYTRPSLRSSGFKTYFLLSMITYARTENRDAHSYLYLFDEPGTYLHPHAQLDLQRSFETISQRTQIVFTTHSLFLVNKNHPGRNRVVSKGKDGTKVDQKPFTKNWKAVRESLGILMSNNFLIAEKTLLVEGPSDVIYVLDAVKKLKALGRIDVDLNDLSTVDAGSSDNYVAMAKLMLSEGREVVAMLDGDKAGDTLEKQLRKVCDAEIKRGKLQFHKLPRDKSSEDVFCDVKLLQEAISAVVDDLVSQQLRKIKTTVVQGDAVKAIRPKDGITLGKTIADESQQWFDVPERVSKLSIALKYEDLVAASGGKVPDDAESEIAEIAKKLSLKSETSKESGVFEEVA